MSLPDQQPSEPALQTPDGQSVSLEPVAPSPPSQPREPVPWSLRQTVIGVLVTLVPWLTLSLVTALMSPASRTVARAVPRQLDIISGVVVFLVSSLIEAIFLIVPLYVVLRLHAPQARFRDRLSWLGFRSTPLKTALMVIVIGLVVGLGGSALYSWAITAFHLPLQTNTDALLQQGRLQPFTTIGLLAAAALVAPVCEEVFFRGFTFAGLLKGMTLWPAVVLSSVIFGVAHTDVGSFIPLFIIGLALAWARWRSDSIWPGIVIHMANNTLAAVALIPLLFR